MQSFLLANDLPLSRIGYGTMRLIADGAWGPPLDPTAAKAILHRALDLGVNLIDTADAYGPQELERFIGETLAPYPAGVVIATKAGLARMAPAKSEPLGRPSYLRQQVEMSLRYLKLEQLPLWQLHRIDPQVPLEDSLGMIRDLQQAGKIRHVGLSEVNVAQIEQARRILPIVSVQNKYNLTERKHEAVLDYCTQNNIAFLPWYPVAAGKLNAPGSKLAAIATRLGATPTQLQLSWLLHRSPVIVPIPGTSSLAHLEENCAALNLTLTPQDLQEIESAVAP
ncbi:aldo/keto reductase [Granulicella tundricola]|uniref:Aldo/keto reductase n=1 Tax=Granulicella tundricola (strain ATCC BAA-1859 / DSM 23138 / MP5ACTX9) TaxID=1198114 RepID=E8WWT1_GRATM|nr:aldo/keto reductase [Granulicella tundricola]ADW67409.1 aldo/keto reductase [Granulicella tundricola MP5ACTX9]